MTVLANYYKEFQEYILLILNDLFYTLFDLLISNSFMYLLLLHFFF